MKLPDILRVNKEHSPSLYAPPPQKHLSCFLQGRCFLDSIAASLKGKWWHLSTSLEFLFVFNEKDSIRKCNYFSPNFICATWTLESIGVVCTGFRPGYQWWISTEESNKIYEKLTLLERVIATPSQATTLRVISKWPWFNEVALPLIRTKWAWHLLQHSYPVSGHAKQMLNIFPAWGSWQWTVRTFHWNWAIRSEDKGSWFKCTKLEFL